jgi:CelD/BcsL family acetyltransferase involved in cellulose biosynthesis
MFRVLELSALRDASQDSQANSASIPVRICVSNQLRDFDVWPRTNRADTARCYAFQCADILELARDTLICARNAEPLFVAILGANDEPLALIPLSIERHNQTRVLTFLDGGFSDYNAPVLFPSAQNWGREIMETVWQGLRRILPPFDIAVFDKMPERIFDFANPFVLLRTSTHPADGHAITLSGTWDELKKKLPHGHNSRYQTRRLDKRGKLSFQVADTPEKYDALLDALMRQKSRRYLETRGVDGLDRPGYRDFLRKAKNLLSPMGPVHLFALAIDDTIIATSWGYVDGSRFYYLVLSFEGGEWRTYSLGRLMLNGLLEWCIARGLKVLDCGVGDEGFKLEYCDVSIPLHQAEIPATAKGRIYLLMRNTKKKLLETKLWAVLRPIVKGARRGESNIII